MLFRFLAAAMIAAPAAAQSADPRAKADRDLFEKVVEIPTVERRGQIPRLTALLSDELRRAGITDVTVKDHEGNPGDKTQTLIARWPAERPGGKRPIVLMAHMDVVDAVPSDWKHDPFTFREEGGYYLGRGANDNKAGIVAIVSALRQLKASGFRPGRDIIVLFTGDEETAGNGARLAATTWGSLAGAEYALNSDAGGGSAVKGGSPELFFMQVAEKTYADFRLTATNRGGHSSAPRADNAIYQLAGGLKALEEYRFKPMLNEATRAFFATLAKRDGGAFGSFVQAWLDDPENMEKADLIETIRPGYTRTRCVATLLSGGHAPNALPQKAEANVNCRIFPGTSPEAVRAELQAIVGKEVTVTAHEVGAGADASPLRPDVAAAYQGALRTKYPKAEVSPSMSAGATDAVFTRSAGIPTYGVAAAWSYLGEPLGAHGLDERIPVKAFHDQIEIWERMIRDLAG
jgi:acetylornithine deacetylase/succinyl-diaminopimelate desuccinylase-like protein